MTDVGVGELKQRLSEYLDRAARGEIVRVTERGRPKAMLVPLPGRLRLDEGLADGWVTAATTSLTGRSRRYPAGERVLDVVSEDRGE